MPVVTVRLHIPAADVDAPSFDADLEVTFAGQTAHNPHVPFHHDMRGAGHHITGIVP